MPFNFGQPTSQAPRGFAPFQPNFLQGPQQNPEDVYKRIRSSTGSRGATSAFQNMGMLGGPRGQAPEITVGGMFTPQQQQQDLNEMRAFAERRLGTQLKQQGRAATAGGFGQASPAQQALQQGAYARTMAELMNNERQYRQTAQEKNAGHLLATQQAAGDRYFRGSDDERQRYGANIAAYQAFQQGENQGDQLAAQMAENQLGREQQVGMANLQAGFNLYGQESGQQSEMDRLRESIGSQERMQDKDLGGQSGRLRETLGSQERMQGKDLDSQLQRLRETNELSRWQSQLQDTRAGKGQELQRYGMDQDDTRQRYMQAQELTAQMQQLQASLASTDKNSAEGRALQAQLAELENRRSREMQIVDLGGQMERLRATLDANRGDANAERTLREQLAMLENNRLIHMQVSSLDAEMARLQKTLSSGEATEKMRQEAGIRIADMNNRKDLMQQGLVNLGAAQRQQVETEGDLLQQRNALAQQQWGQQYQAAVDKAAREQQFNFGGMQMENEWNRGQQQALLNDWLTQRQIQGQNNASLNQKAYEYGTQMPFARLQADRQFYQNMYPYSPQWQNYQNMTQMYKAFQEAANARYANNTYRNTGDYMTDMSEFGNYFNRMWGG